VIDDDKRMEFILGMDGEKVAAGIAAKYSTILRHIEDGREGASADKLAIEYQVLVEASIDHIGRVKDVNACR
jgi:hypothetical protein